MAIPVSMYQDIVAAQDKVIAASTTDNFPLSSATQMAMTTIQQAETEQQQLTLQNGYTQDTLDSQSIAVQAVAIETKSEPE